MLWFECVLSKFKLDAHYTDAEGRPSEVFQLSLSRFCSCEYIDVVILGVVSIQKVKFIPFSLFLAFSLLFYHEIRQPESLCQMLVP